MTKNITKRYVGRTTGNLQGRLKDHLYNSYANKTTAWFSELREANLEPIIEGIEITTDKEAEERWIKYYRDEGFLLLNHDFQKTADLVAKLGPSGICPHCGREI